MKQGSIKARAAETVIDCEGNEMTLEVSSRAYEKMVVPAFPKWGDTHAWLTQLKRNVVAVAPCTDRIEVKWLDEVYSKTFKELAVTGSPRLTRCDLVMSQKLAVVIHKSGENLSEDAFLADRDAAYAGDIIMGR